MTRSERPRRVIVAVLLSLAFVTGLIGMFAVWVNRQALNTDNWTHTSGRLLADKQVQKALSAYLVEELFANVDVASELQKALPPQAAALAGPAAAGLQELAGRAAPRLLASPRVQEAWRTANRTAHEQLLAILDDKGSTVSTQNGVVTLNVRTLVDSLAARLGIEKQVAAARSQLQGGTGATARGIAQEKLGVTLPANTGQIEILRSDELDTAQSIARGVRHLAVVFTALPLLLFALAIGLASGWRRVALRSVGWCFVGLGILVLLGRRVGGDAVVDALAASPSVRPAAESTWAIGTTLLYDIAVAMVFYGIAFVLAAWVAGATRPAFAIREALAPALRYHLASSYGAVAILYLLLLAWGPTPAMRKPLGILLFAVLIVLGVEVLRRQVAREFPDAQSGDSWARLKKWGSGARASMSRHGDAAEAQPALPRDTVKESDAVSTRFDDLEQLASLHDRGVLSDDEFASQKTLVLEGSQGA
jgi:hypothetical protein